MQASEPPAADSPNSSSEPRVRVLARAAALAIPLAGLLYVLAPMLADLSTYGFHDWDVETAYRYITVLGLRHGEGPWWHPYLCGGVPAWGYVEGATNLVSPYLPLYLLADIRVAIRVEVFGQALLALAGCWFFAGRFTTSVALRALLGVLFVLNGRWALQAAVGHTWHLQYALMPWAFYCFERALEPGRLRFAAGAGASLALACYWGGIYPLPHTALLLSLYAGLRAAGERKVRPLAALALVAAVAFGLSAPKLFAVLDHMRDVPRLIESTEVIGFRELLVMLLAPDQRYGARPVPVPAYNWHEWGIYIGPIGLFVLGAAVIFGRGVRTWAFKLLGLLCLLLGFGAFHGLAPWALLHELPIFSSQHVPSRFHYPMLLMFGAAFVAHGSELLAARLKEKPWLDLALLVPVAMLAWDMARFSRTPFEQAFWMRAPENIERAEPFVHRRGPPVHYVQRDWAAPMLLAMFANTGVTRCYGVDPEFKPSAVPAESSRYRGLVFVDVVPADAGASNVPARIPAALDAAVRPDALRAEPSVELVEWTPNRAVVEVRDVPAGAVLVYDMNHDPSWRANGERALEYDGLVAARIEPGVRRVEFSYFPRTLAWSLPLALVTLAACFVRKRDVNRVRAVAVRLRARRLPK